MNAARRSPLALLAAATMVACAAPGARTPAPAAASYTAADRTADSLVIAGLLARSREAHVTRRADLLVADHADSLLSVSGGRVSVTGRAQLQARFQPYLDASTFQAWDDVVPPRIRVSDDGRMAWVVVEKRVHLTAPGPAGTPVAERVRYAWMSVYEKQGGQWRMVAIASTDRPDAP